MKILAPSGTQRNAILREVNGQIAIYDIFSSPPIAIQELDPTSITTKHKKGKQVVTQNEEKHSSMDGGLAEAAMQPRPAQ